MDRCGWSNYPDGGSVGCCLSDPHEPYIHCAHPLWDLTAIPRHIVRRSDGRNVACVRQLNTEWPEGMAPEDRGQSA